MKRLMISLLLCLPVLLLSQSKLEILVSPDLSYRTDSEYISTFPSGDLFRTSEVPKLSFHFQINYLQKIKDKLWLKVGVGFTSLGYKNEARDFYYLPKSNSSGMGTAFPGGVLIDEIRISERSIKKYYFFEIPVALRFDFSPRKITPFIELGLSTMYYLQSESVFFSKTEKLLTNRERSETVNQLQYAPTLALGFSYQMNKNIEWFCQPNFRFHLSSMVKDASIEEHQWSAGLGLGMRMNL